MKKLIKFYIIFSICFVCSYLAFEQPYETPQKAFLYKKNVTGAPCYSINRPYASIYQRQNKTFYYYCSNDPYVNYEHIAHDYISEEKLMYLSLISAILITFIIFIFKYI
jgi:hypothetical protein